MLFPSEETYIYIYVCYTEYFFSKREITDAIICNTIFMVVDSILIKEMK